MLDIKGQDVIRRVYAPTGAAPTLTTMAGGNREPKIIQTNQRNETVTKDVVGTVHQFMSSRQAPKILQCGRGFNDGGLHEIAPTVSSHSYHENNMVVSAVLTPDREEKRQNGRRIKEPDEPMFTLTAQDKHGVMVVGNTNPSGHGMNGNVFDAKGLAPTLTTNKDEGNKILVNRDVANTVRTSGRSSFDGKHSWDVVSAGARIRKLTPRECWRLMGRTDEDFDKAKAAGISDSQLYRQAGNSLVPQIVTEIGKRLTP